MKSKLTKLAQVVTFGLAMVFTFSCSPGNDDNGGGISSCPDAVTGNGTVSCGGQTYRTVVIGTQTWMAENLNYDASGSICYDCTKYGRLYNWATAMGIDAKYYNVLWGGSDVKHRGICPIGWHLPSDAEWSALISYVENDKGCSNCAAKHLKASSGWYEGKNGTNEYGFSALPGGFSFSDAGGDDIFSAGKDGYWWSSSEYGSDHAYDFSIYTDQDVYREDVNKFLLSSVRCVQD